MPAWMFSAASGRHDTDTPAAAAAADAGTNIPSLLELIQPHQVADLQRCCYFFFFFFFFPCKIVLIRLFYRGCSRGSRGFRRGPMMDI